MSRLTSAFSVRHPVFRPLWRRLLLVGACFSWAGFEWLNGESLWALVFAGAGAWCAHQFFIAFDPKDYDQNDTS